MLFKLSVRNLRRSIRDYAVYFVTLVIGVAIFYVFNAVGTQAAFLRVSEDTRDIIRTLITTLSGVSVFVSLVLGFLIVYASRFLMKRRNREFALYLLLGMGKRKISAILVIETFLIGMLSLAVGLAVGVAGSQVMSTLVAQMFEADMTAFAFTFSGEAFVKTILYFAVMYLVVMLFNTVTISRCKLISLMQTGKQAERVRMKDPVLCAVVFAASWVILGIAYYLVTGGYHWLRRPSDIAIPILMGSVGTFLLFWSLSGLLLLLASSRKKMYYRGINSFTFRQVSSRVNTMVVSMTVICLMLFMTIGILSAALSLRNAMNDNLRTLAPADLVIEKRMNGYPGEADQADGLAFLDIQGAYRQAGADLSSYFQDCTSVLLYRDETLTIESSLGATAAQVREAYPYLPIGDYETVVPVSQYNGAARLYGQPEYTLGPDEYVMVCNHMAAIEPRNPALALGTKLTVFGRELSPKYDACQPGFLEMASNYTNIGLVVVPDEVIAGQGSMENYFIGNYAAGTEEGKAETEKTLRQMAGEIGLSLRFNSQRDIRATSVGLGALVTFVGLYLGLVFLISSAAVLALKALSDSVDSAGRYQMLRRIGVEERDLSRSLFRQTGLLFLLPLLLAGVHSIFGVQFTLTVLETFGREQMLRSMLVTILILALIYGGYFLVTCLGSRSIIRERSGRSG